MEDIDTYLVPPIEEDDGDDYTAYLDSLGGDDFYTYLESLDEAEQS